MSQTLMLKDFFMQFSIKQGFSTVLIALLSFFLYDPLAANAEELVVYSARKENLIEPLFDAYTRETGVKITFITAPGKLLLNRLEKEGEKTPADLLIMVDAGSLWRASRRGMLQPLDSAVLKSNIPEHLRDPGNQWYGLSLRARIIVYSNERVTPEELSTYEALGNPVWKGRLLLRTSKSVYSQSLVAMLHGTHGREETEAIVRSWVTNLGREPFETDSEVMEAIIAGQGDVGIVNSYYFGRLLKENPDIKLSLFWPNQDTTGVFVDVAGAGITRHTKNPQTAQKFLEWLSSKRAQYLFANANMEYPVNKAANPHPYLLSWGDFKVSNQNLAITGQLQESTLSLIEKANYR